MWGKCTVCTQKTYLWGYEVRKNSKISLPFAKTYGHRIVSRIFECINNVEKTGEIMRKLLELVLFHNSIFS